MGFFDRLLGRTPKPKPAASNPDQSTGPDLIKMFDAYGREVFISRGEWRSKIIPHNLKSAWDDPESLRGFIVQCMQNGFFDDVVSASERLVEIHPNHADATVILGVAYLNTKRLDDAQRVLEAFVAKHGDETYILNNLSKVYSAQGKEELAQMTLWRALEVDPNNANALARIEAQGQERSGAAGSAEAYRRVAALPKSWRAQVWLARIALDRKDLPDAMGNYQVALLRAGNPPPAEVLMQISGDLGMRGYINELLEVVAPQFNPEAHGLEVGNNLIKAHFDRGELDAATKIINQLYALQRPDWKPTLEYWETEVAKARLTEVPMPKVVPLDAAMTKIDGPVWLPITSPAVPIFEADRGDRRTICFFGSSVTSPDRQPGIAFQLADAQGRITRAVPLFLSEQTYFNFHVATQAAFPCAEHARSAFILYGGRWTEDEAANVGKKSDCEWTVVSQLNAASETWNIELRIVRCADAALLSTLNVAFPRSTPHSGLPVIAAKLLPELAKLDLLKRLPPKAYVIPERSEFDSYLLRLEQLLAIRCSEMELPAKSRLNNEREIVDGNLRLCLDCPANNVTRVLLGQTLLSLKKVRPDILPEFKDKVAKLNKEHALTPPASVLFQRIFDEAFAAGSG